MEKNKPKTSTNGTSTTKHHNRVQPVNDGTERSSSSGHRNHHHHKDHHRSRHHHDDYRHHRRRSYSSCSTCSDTSHEDFHSDISFNHYHHQNSEPGKKTITPRTRRARTPSPPKTHRSSYRDSGVGTGHDNKVMRRSGVTTDLEDVPSMFQKLS